MSDPLSSPCCPAGQACEPDRRSLLALGGAALAASLFSLDEAVAGPFEGAEFEKLIPAEKKFKPEWLASLTARGTPETRTGDDLKYIGMPVGGIATGTLYLGGDGRLWLWDIFNRISLGLDPKPASYDGRALGAMDGSRFVAPLEQVRPVEQGFALRIGGAEEKPFPLDRTGFQEVSFTGEYPIGTVTYRDPRCPLSVRLEAFSPFLPLNADDSGLPATVFSFVVKNESKATVEATLTGWLENAVCLHHREYEGLRKNRVVVGEKATTLECSVARAEGKSKPRQPDVIFEDWDRDDYAPWTVEGQAFGKGPIRKKDIPPYQGNVAGPGSRVVNSHATAPGADIGAKDGAVGRLRRDFTVSRNFIHLWVGGGNHPGQTGVNVLVDGKVVRSVTGQNNNQMRLVVVDVKPWLGKKATLEIVDNVRGPWGNIGVGRITFSDQAASGPLETLPDHGTLALTLLGPAAEVQAASVQPPTFTGKAATSAETPLSDRLIGALGRRFRLEPGQTTQVHFVLAWHFPNLSLLGVLQGRYYAARFASASAVSAYVVRQFDRLASTTRLWRDTWNDSTLPHWFLNRTFANTSILATSTCYRLRDGRFWGWEGVGCCPGTCTHVWHYAQAMGRLFPELERDLRERVDYGLAFDTGSGVIRYRGEFGATFAVDGQCGTILRAFREHQMSKDPAFLKRIWPRVKQSMQAVIQRDREQSGIVVGPMHNTLDADWFGVVPWIVGLYHAALRASEEMATEMGDEAFARRCRQLFERGKAQLDRTTWRDEYGYYVHVGDPKHPTEVGSYDGCHIDQVFGQSWAWQVGLGSVMDARHVRRALGSLYRYAVVPDVGPFRKVNRPGRWYAMPGDGGLLMVTFPFGRPRQVTGPGAWSAMYFNECMSGFEWQVAGHMLWEGMVTEGLVVARLIHDRYHPRLRNPYNEIECSDHYARAMASYGAYLAACGFVYHGPRGHLAFAPRLTPDNFRAAFTTAEGWGTFQQSRQAGTQTARLLPRFGSVRLRSFGLELPSGATSRSVVATLDGRAVECKFNQTGSSVVVTFDSDVRVNAGETLTLAVNHQG
ncbi:MAG: GH116 family glycosyl-hydrolase [Gemmataceae bacterium]